MDRDEARPRADDDRERGPERHSDRDRDGDRPESEHGRERAGDTLVDLVITFSAAASEKASTWLRDELPWPAFARRMTRHRRGSKHGSAITPAIFAGPRREAGQATAVRVAVLDIDNGTPFADIVDRLRAAGLAAAVATTHSHGRRELLVPVPEWEGWQRREPGGSAEAFMLSRQFHAAVAKEARLRVRRASGETVTAVDGKDRACVVVDHWPCAKVRVWAPARDPWQRDQGPAAYRAGLEGLARGLGLQVDPSGFDLAHLFFEPRFSEDRPPPKWEILSGRAANVWPRGQHEGATARDAVDGSADFEAQVRAARTARRNAAVPIEEVREAALAVRNDSRFDSRAAWVKFCAAVHAATGGSEEGFAIFQAWSATWPGGNDPEADRDVWESIRGDHRPGHVTASSLFWFARRDGWKPQIRIENEARGAFGDLWFGEVIAHHVRGNMIFVAAEGTWLRWTDPCWAALAGPEVDAVAKELVRRYVEAACEAAVREPNRFSRVAAEALKVHRSLKRARQAIEAAQSEPGMHVPSRADFDRDPMLLGVRNGVLDLRAGKLIPAHPDQLISKLAGTSFDPDAQAPQWRKLIAWALPDPDEARFLQDFAGYTLTGLVDHEALLFCFGTGANGKSVVAKIMERMMGEYAATVPTLLLMQGKNNNEAERHKTRLMGKRMVLANETNQGDVMNEGMVKEITSRDRIAMRKLYSEGEDFDPTHKLWIRGNHKPGVRDSGDGFWRRIIPLHFARTIDERDKVSDLDARIIATELPGVLAWAVEGWRRVQRHGLRVPRSIEAERKQYRADTDTVAKWLEEACERDVNARETQAALFDSFRQFTAAENESPGIKRRFGDALEEKGFNRDRGTGGARVHKGLRLKPKFQDFDQPRTSERSE